MTSLLSTVSECKEGREELFADGDSLFQTGWDPTSLEPAKRCPRLYQLSILEGWRKGEQNDDIIFGHHLHDALEMVDKAWLKSDGTVEIDHLAQQAPLFALNVSMEWKTVNKYKNRYTLSRSIVEYVDSLYEGKAKPFAFSDGTPANEISFRILLPFTVEGETVFLCGHIDSFCTHGPNAKYIRERKTTKSTISPRYFQQFYPGTQVEVYDIEGATQLKGLGLRGVIVEAFQTAVQFTRIARHPIAVKQEVREENLRDIQYWIGEAYKWAQEGYWPKNTSACYAKFGQCDFAGICTSRPARRRKLLEANFVREKWNPIEIRN